MDMSKSIIEQLRESLTPIGSEPIVRLSLQNHYFEYDFVLQCLNELDKIYFNIKLGQEITPLQRLAICVLTDSANITKEKIK